jgi:hypothetical protein
MPGTPCRQHQERNTDAGKLAATLILAETATLFTCCACSPRSPQRAATTRNRAPYARPHVLKRSDNDVENTPGLTDIQRAWLGD